jgi:phenylalanyl-tRNA synthetase beta chain
MVAILERLGMKVEVDGDELSITPPPNRLDIDIKEAIVEEVGRIYGYDRIKPLELPPLRRLGGLSSAEKNFAVHNKIREILLGLGFSEVALYPIVSRGAVALVNPLAEDKSHLRDNLIDANLDRLVFNLQYALFDNEPVKIFEFGHIFKTSGEEAHLSIGLTSKLKKFDAGAEITAVVKALGEALGTNLQGCVVAEKAGAVELNLDKLVGKIESALVPDLDPYIASDTMVYKPTSPYPRMIRDVAIWVPVVTEESEVARVIKESAGPLLDIGPLLFDTFEKDGRKSLAFRLVLQSYERTLSDEEAGNVMAGVIDALEQNEGWEVRK